VLQVQNIVAFPGGISVIISNNYCLFQQGGLGERCKFPEWDQGWSPRSQSIFRFYI